KTVVDTIRVPNGSTVRMIAHRGASSLERENTLPAFLAACNRSFYGIETDVHPTSDGGFVIMHDSNTSRVAFEEAILEESTLEEIAKIRIRDLDGEFRQDLRVPLYSEYLKLCRKYGKRPIIELKGEFSGEQFDRFIKESGDCSDLTFISFDEGNLISLRSRLPSVSLQYLTGSWDDEVRSFLREYRLDLDLYYGTMFSEDGKEVDRSIPETLHREGKLLNVWTVDTLPDAIPLISAGVDMITSNTLE
ncbi:MAG: hypothetical protein II719_00880, partial [Clostridia bacterium]|nr:hypothetical protein [Clostridia bacterium]